MAKKLKVTQIRSTIGRLTVQKKTMRALGIKKMHQTVMHDDMPSIRGMINRVKHLVVVQEIDGE